MEEGPLYDEWVSTMKIVCIEFEGQPRVLENLGHLPNINSKNKTEKCKN